MEISILLIVFLAICGINSIYLLFLLRFTFQKERPNTNSKALLSVLIYIKNREDILPNFLDRLLLLENFEKHQFLFINHASHDNSEDILEAFSLKYPNTQLVNVENKETFWGSKRYALTLGIKQAIHKNLVFISPNTYFEENNWTSATQNNFEKEYSIGYSGITKEKGIGNKIIRFYTLLQETYHLGILSFGKSVVLNEYNIGYSNNLFFENSGFNKRINQYEGTQSLLYQDIGKTKNTSVSKKNITRQKFTWDSWKEHQFYRWNTLLKSSFATKLLLCIFLTTQYLFWPLFILGCTWLPTPLLFIVAGIRILLFSIVTLKNGIDFNEKDILYFFPFIELLSLLLGIYIFFRNLLKPKTRYYF